MLASAWTLSGFESGLIYSALGIFGGASFVSLRVVRGRRPGRVLRPMLAIGTAALTLLLLAIGLREGYFPAARRYEVLIFAAWALAVGGWLIDRRMQLGILAPVAAPTLALLILFAILLVPETGKLAPESRAGLLSHILLALLGFSAFAFAAGVGTLYLWQIRILKKSPSAAVTRRIPPLEVLDRLNLVSAAFGFPLLALSMLAGWLFLASAEDSPLNWWLDPTVLATCAGLLVYGFLFAGRACFGWHGRVVAWLTVIGFLVTVAGFFVAGLCTSESPNILHTS
jgi:ABC-type transport system involved in cytochrome c biogenesis permease subunit